MALIRVTKFSKFKGMTLLEVLVAIALMVVVSAISYVSLNSLIDGKHHTDEVSEKLQEEIITLRQLNSDFESMINRSIKSHRGEPISPVVGDLKSISFVRNGYSNPLNQFRSELQRVQWLYRNGELIRRQTQQLETQQTPQWQQRTYLTGVKDIRIEYYDLQGLRTQRWPMNTVIPMLPQSVLIEIEMHDGREKQLYLSSNRGRL